MAQSSLKARNGKGYKFFPNIQARNHVSDNLLRRDFTAERPDEKWVSDITYIALDKGFVYLAVIMDLYSRKIIGWSLDSTMTNQLIIDAFQMAYDSRHVKPGLILHSDRGVQYRSGEYQHRLLSNGIRPSMSRKGNCWDNAAMESFFSRLKVESIYAEQPTTKQEAYSLVFEYIELFYNRVRRHSAIGYSSPAEYEQEYYEKCAWNGVYFSWVGSYLLISKIIEKEFIMKKVVALFFIALLSTAYAEAQDVNGCHAGVKVYECR